MPGCGAAAVGKAVLSLGALFTLGASELTSSFADPTDELDAGSSVRPGTDHENAKTERGLADGRALLALLPATSPPAAPALCSFVVGEEAAALSRATLAFASTANKHKTAIIPHSKVIRVVQLIAVTSFLNKLSSSERGAPGRTTQGMACFRTPLFSCTKHELQLINWTCPSDFPSSVIPH